MPTITLKTLPFPRLKWGEGLMWDERNDALYLVDCMQNLVLTTTWLTKGEGTPQQITTPSMPTKVLLTSDINSPLILIEDGFHSFDQTAVSVDPLIPMPESCKQRFNDACVDNNGRIVTGTLGFVPEDKGDFWRWDDQAETQWEVFSDDKINTNGPCIDPESKCLYISDTGASIIHRYDYDIVTGKISNQQIFANTEKLGGRPDGATLDNEHCLWVALFGGSKIIRYSPAGDVLMEIETPAENPTDVLFAGPNLDRLIVTSAASMTNTPNDLGGHSFEILNHGISALEPAAKVNLI